MHITTNMRKAAEWMGFELYSASQFTERTICHLAADGPLTITIEGDEIMGWSTTYEPHSGPKITSVGMTLAEALCGVVAILME